MAQRTNPSVNRNSGTTDRLRRRRLANYNTPSKQLGAVLGRTREKDNAERKATGRIRSINRSARSRYATPRRSEMRSGGRLRRTPFHSGKFSVDVDDNEIAARYQQIMDIYARGKINTKNAWRLKLVENIERMIKLEASGNFKKCSATIAAATQIYHYRVDDVYTNTFKMLNNFGGVSDSTGVSAKRKKPVNVNTLISRSAAAVDLNRVVCRVDPMFHKTTSAFDEGGSRGLLLNTLSVHNGCDIIFDSTTVVTKGPKKAPEEKAEANVEQKNAQPQDKKENMEPEKEKEIPAKDQKKMDEDVDSDEEHPSWISTVSASHEVHRFQAREICPGVSAITDAIGKVEEADKKRSDSQSEERGPKRLNFADEPNEVMDFANIDTTAMFDGNDFNVEQQEADMLLELDRSQQHPDYFYTSSANNSMEMPNIGGTKANSVPHGDYSVFVESDPRLSEENKENYLFHPSLLNSWTGPEKWISRRQLFRRRFKELQRAEEKKKAKKKDISEHQINFQQIVEGKQCPEELLCPPKRPFSTMLTMACQEKLRNDLNIYPEDLHIERKILTQLFMKPSLHVARRARVSGESDFENDGGQGFWENELDVTGAPSEYFDADPMGSPNTGNQGLQLVNDRPDVGPVIVEYARISKKINIKTLKDNIWRYIQRSYSMEAPAGQPSDSAAAAAVEEPPAQLLEETLEQPDRGVMTHLGTTTFRSTLRHICMDSRQKDELSVPFAFMALLHLANLKSLRFVPMKEGPFGSDFHIYADKVASGS